MNPGLARCSLRIVAALLAMGTGALTFAGEPGDSPVDALVASSDCPEPRRAAPRRPAKPRPEIEAPRDRPPSSLPCCKGADCTCSGPPALAAAPPEAVNPAAARLA